MKRHRMRRLPLSLTSALVGLLPVATAAGSCTDHQPGIVLTVTARPAPAPGTPIALADGSQVTLEPSYLAISAIELLACPATATARLPALLRLLSPVATAHAHSTGSATRSGIPLVLALGQTGAAAGQPLATLGPPPGRYCQLAVELGPADADATGLPGPEMLGETLLLRGQQAAAGGATQALDVQRRGVQRVVLDLAGPLELEDAGLNSLEVAVDLPGWLAALDPAALGRLFSSTEEPWTDLEQPGRLVSLPFTSR
jgi:hypothetical protein